MDYPKGNAGRSRGQGVGHEALGPGDLVLSNTLVQEAPGSSLHIASMGGSGKAAIHQAKLRSPWLPSQPSSLSEKPTLCTQATVFSCRCCMEEAAPGETHTDTMEDQSQRHPADHPEGAHRYSLGPQSSPGSKYCIGFHQSWQGDHR